MNIQEHIDRAETILHDVEVDGCEQHPAGRAAAAVARAHIELAKVKMMEPIKLDMPEEAVEPHQHRASCHGVIGELLCQDDSKTEPKRRGGGGAVVHTVPPHPSVIDGVRRAFL